MSNIDEADQTYEAWLAGLVAAGFRQCYAAAGLSCGDFPYYGRSANEGTMVVLRHADGRVAVWLNILVKVTGRDSGRRRYTDSFDTWQEFCDEYAEAWGLLGLPDPLPPLAA